MTRFHMSIETMRRWLKTSTALTTAVVMGIGQPALALAQGLPTGGTVAAGSATIAQPNASSLVINQTSQSAITNWQSFSIGQGNSVAVVQPSTSAAMLARVTGSTASTIAGSLTATGQLMLVNPNGIAITPTGTVKAGSGFIATTLNTTDDDFLAGRAKLTGNGASNAVKNAGTITVGPGGYAALIGGTVANSGTISVPMGKVGLGSGEVATLDFSGDGFLQVGVPTNASGTDALITNAGKIVATGGRVEIKAAAARDAARHAINMSGVVAARSVSGSDGNITLDGGEAQVQVSGKLTAASRTGKGGNVTVTGRDIRLAHARVNASGKTGGGTVKVGGDRQGTGTLAHAQTTAIDKTSIIKADATSTGTGGSVTVWSDLRADFAGRISAQGGPNGGNGGEAEVSSHGVLTYTGTTVLTAPMGSTGTLLLDPYNVTISNGTDSAPLSAPSNGSTSFTASANDSVLSVATLQSALAGANVTVSTGSSGSQAGDITIAAPLSWSANLLRLDAAHSINVAATVTVGGTGALMLNTNVGGGTGGTIDFGLTSAGFTGKIDFTGTPSSQTLTINGTQYTLLASMADVANANNGLAGNYALARNIDASGQTYTDALIGHDNSSPFTGTFDGLGHTISTLTINKAGAYAGLIGATSGTIRNIGMAGGSVSGAGPVGGLAGYSSGVITNAYATGGVRGSGFVGGLVGDGTNISNAYATGAVNGAGSVGGLVGYLRGALNNAHATGTVSGASSIGGLVGRSGGTIANAYATGAVSGGDYAGGLVGLAQSDITNSYATGTVNGGSLVGGLIGLAQSTLSNAYATGAVSGSTFVGGLAGRFDPGSSVVNAYATGAVTGSTYVGGLAGYVDVVASVSNVYATGAVSGGSIVGGLVGDIEDQATITNAYWNKQTTGQSIGLAVDNSGGTNQLTGLTTAQLQNGTSASGLGNAFTLSNGLYPYLTSFFSNGVQAISGIAYSDSGRTPYASGSTGTRTVFVDIGGQQVAATTGANGYYYIQLANGTLSAANGGTPVLAYTRANGASGAVSGAQLTTAGGNLGTLDVWGGHLIAPTSATRLSNAGSSVAGLLSANGGANQTLLTTAAGGDTVATNATTGVAGLTSIGYIASNSAGFTIDQTIATGELYVKTTAGPITVSASQTISGPNNLTLLSAGDLNINAAIQMNGNGAVNLAYNGNLNVALGGSGFTGGLTFVNADGSSATTSAGGTLTVNGNAVTLLYTMADVTNVNNGLSGNYALAHNLDVSGTTYTDALIGRNNNSAFTGTFDGLGHTISNLTINKAFDNYAGLFGNAGGTIRNVGLVGGSVTGSAGYVGGLAGYSSGPITNVYATGAVSGAGSIGGLVGYSAGPITNAFATGAVSGEFNTGGLVGQARSNITNAYATGAVNGGTYVGGLAGTATGIVTNVYATGAVIGQTGVGGLVGSMAGGTVTKAYATGAVIGLGGSTNVAGVVGISYGSITNGFWNTETTGQTIGIAANNGSSAQLTGLTTAQLQNGTSASGLGNAFTLANGLNPYLTSFFLNGVQAISGIAYSDSGRTINASGVNGARTVFVDIGGQQVAATTGANGYYYVQLANGTLSASNGGTPVLAYTQANGTSGAVSGARLTTASGTLGDLDVWGNMLIAPTSAARLSNAGASVAGLLSANGGANQTLLTTAAGGDVVATNATAGVAGLASAGYVASNAAGFTIDQAIAGTSLFVKTTAGLITVATNQTLSNSGSLALLSAGDINLNAGIQINGNGAANLAYSGNINAALNGSGFTGGLTFANADGTAATTSAGGTLTVNGTAYTLLYSMADVANANNGLSGTYALARNLDASGTTYTDTLIGHDNTTPFTGTFDGLGHTVNNLTINKASGNYAGLFGYADSATIRNIGVVGGSINGGDSVGGLVGTTRSGTVVSNAFATGTVNGTGNLGGLIGTASGTLTNVYATGAVTGGNRGNYIGGLVGAMLGSVRNAYATGSVITGTQAMFVGGLVGSPGGSLTNVYATGTVTTGSGSSYVGGLAGYIRGPSDTITNAYATGAVTGGSGSTNVGGLVGDSWGTLTNVYAMGAVSGGTNVGGLLGGSNGSLINAYATGVVSGVSAVGGLAGITSTFGSSSNAYWNITTSGLTAGFGQNDGNQSATGLSTAQLQDGASAIGLGNGFVLSSGLYPYLANLAPNGVRAASGFAYKDAGVTRLASGASGNGQVFVRFGNGTVTMVTTGADGYYYAIVANDGSASPVIAYTLVDQSTGATNGIAVRTADASATQSLDISGGWRRDVTGSASLSALDAAYTTATAGTSASGLTFANRSIASQAAFNIDSALSLSGTLYLRGTAAVTQSAAISAASLILDGTGATFSLKNNGNQIGSLVAAGTSTSVDIYSSGNLSIAASATGADNTTVSGVQTDGIRIAAGGNLTIANGAMVAGLSPVLAAGGAFINNAGASALTASNGRWLVYAAGPAGNTYGGLNSGNAAVWNTAAGGAVTATGNRYVFAYQPVLTLTAGNAAKTYGDVATLSGYTLSGFQTGVTGAYLADTQATAVSGMASLTSAGAAATANAGTYTIAAARGSLNAGGYGFAFVNGSLSVSTRPITVTADAQSRIFGTADPVLTYTIGGLGLVNGDQLSGALATTATATSGTGTYAIAQGSLAASSNYALAYTGALLTVTPAATDPTTGGTGTTTPVGISAPGTGTTTSGTSTPGTTAQTITTNTPGTTGSAVTVITPPPGVFANVPTDTGFIPTGVQGGFGGTGFGFGSSGPAGVGGFTSPGYDTPTTCVAGRACGS